VYWFTKSRLPSSDETESLLALLEAAVEGAVRSESLQGWLEAVVRCVGAKAGWLARRAEQWEVSYGAAAWQEYMGQVQAHQSFLTHTQDCEWVGTYPTDDGMLLACPLNSQLCPNTVLLFLVKAEDPDVSKRWTVALHHARALLSWIVRAIEQARTLQAQALDLRLLLETTRKLAACRDTTQLLEAIASAATEMLDAERASIFVWDRQAREVVARPALGVEGGELRLPDRYGIVGEVLHRGEPAIVNDVTEHPRFKPDVDQKTGFSTRSVLAVPLIDPTDRKLGVFEVLNKRSGGFSTRDRWLLERLAEQVAVVLQNTQERERLARVASDYAAHQAAAARIVGQSRAIRELRATIARLAQTELPVLIQGESGTGKEVVARAIHLQSRRRDGPFIAVNCAALAETLLESELFGHEKGAFTDAREARPGKFELAQGGTLFLDEIGDMSPAGQAKLLRVLEEKSVYRVGGTKLIAVDVRVIAATNRDLARRVEEGRFREDLFFRLSVVTIQLPPLRQRRDDVLPLVEYFLERFCHDAGRARLELTDAARRRLLEHDWPGNVRELRNLVERLAFLAPGPRIDADEIERILATTALRKEAPGIGVPTGLTLSEATAEFQRRYIREAIERAGGNVAEAGRLLGIHRANLYRKMKQLGMNRDG